MKKLITLLLLLSLTSAQAGEVAIRQSLQSKFPGIGALESIVKTPYSGLYEVVIGDKIMYTDEAGQYIIDGNVIDTKTRTNLTEQRHSKLFAIAFDKLPLELAVKKVKGNGSRKLAYFTDPNCGYCKKLEKELANISDVTLYMFMYPIFNGSDEVVRNIRCAKDPVKSWDDLMLNGIKPAQATCTTPTDKIMALGRKLHVSGTPNLIFADGAQLPGYLPAEQLVAKLNESVKK
jgi:thiol:disulfide interchange protein DsbC